MSRLERSLLYGMSVVVLAGLVASSLRSREAVRPVVHAADVHDNAMLDVVRRGLSFAQSTCINERARGVRLQKSSTQGDRTMAKEAFARAQDWYKTEIMLRGLFVAEVKRIMKDAKYHAPSRTRK